MSIDLKNYELLWLLCYVALHKHTVIKNKIGTQQYRLLSIGYLHHCNHALETLRKKFTLHIVTAELTL